jgi:hypothetical protein
MSSQFLRGLGDAATRSKARSGPCLASLLARWCSDRRFAVHSLGISYPLRLIF